MQSRSSNHEITGVLSHISQVFENSDGTRVVIADVVILGKTVVVKGQAAEDELVINHTYRLYGRYKTHPKYGDQFMFSQVVPDTPSGRHAVCCYLKTLKGVGETTAVEMWNRFGENAVQMLRENPEDVAAAMPGRCRFTPEKAQQASVFLRRWHRIEKAKLDLMGLLMGRRVPKKTVDKILKDYGSAAAHSLRLNPYLLQRYRGCSFLTADKLYLDLKKSPFRLKRQALCCAYSVAKKSTGDTWFPLATAREYLRESIAGAEQRFEKALELSLRGKILEQRVDPMGVAWVAEIGKSSSERALAGFVTRSTRDVDDGFSVLWPAADDLDDLTEHQREAVATATRSHIGILAGSPGTGKTFSVARLVAKIIDQYGAHAIAICAPTGKATVRATESMQNAGVNISATTTYSLLKVSSSDDGDFRFEHNEDAPLPHVFIVVDEVSMLDVPLMRSLLSARRPGCHVLFVGDVNQLSPVGHGAPLRDLIQAGLPTGVLTKIERNSGQIVRACAEMRDHKRFTPSPRTDIEKGENLIHVECKTADDQIQFMLAMLQKLKTSETYDVIWDVQIVCAVNKKSPLSRRELNKIVQAELNPGGKQVDGNPFRVGDKIICTANGYYTSLETNDGKTENSTIKTT